jgi:cytosine/adenosine deaminase-related metal-dependent hydrolase
MKYVQGLIFQETPELSNDGFGFIEGYIGFDNGTIIEIGNGELPPYKKNKDLLGKGIVIPTLVNPHTHIGDSIAKGIKIPEFVTIESLLGPPNGLKHRILRESSEKELITAMKLTMKDMVQAGTSEFCDFRELGKAGVTQLKTANEGLPIRSIIFGRPQELEYIEHEFRELLTEVDGIGISSISDYNYEVLEKIANKTKAAEKGVALHASERVREDINRVLDLKPDFLIHMTKGTPEDFQNLNNNDIPVIICPRSNLFFGNTPPISRMLEEDLTIGLGTDNVMLNHPDIFQEMKAAYSILSNQWNRSSVETVREIFKMGILNPRKIINYKYNIPQQQIQVGAEAKFILIEIPYKDLEPIQIIVNKVEIDKISVISIGQKFLWSKKTN